jgi:hypothetical protein
MNVSADALNPFEVVALHDFAVFFADEQIHGEEASERRDHDRAEDRHKSEPPTGPE